LFNRFQVDYPILAFQIQAKHKNYKIGNNQELISLGLANIVASFFQAFPTTGGLSRTAINDQAGAKSGVAAILSATVVTVTLLFLTPLFYHLPKTILASIIMMAVFGLIDIREAHRLWRADRRDFWMLIITFLATLFFGIEQGIGIGILLSISLIIYQSTRPHIALLGKVPGTSYYRNIKRFETLEKRHDVLILRFDAQLYFANSNYFKDNLEKWVNVQEASLKAVILNAESITGIDSTAMHMLAEIVQTLAKKNITFYMCDVKGPVRDALKRGKLTTLIGESHFFINVQNAIDAIDTRLPSHYHHYVLQSNVDP